MSAEDFDPVTLRLFISACEQGSISKAADSESMVPSAASKRLAALAQELQVGLLRRSGGGVVPTAAGLSLLVQARQILSTMRHARAQLADFAAGASGHVRVFASTSALSERLPDDIGSFLAKYKTARVSIHEKSSFDVVAGVQEGRADLGVCWNLAVADGVDTRPYRTDHPAVLLHPGHPLARRAAVTFSELLDYEHVGVMPGSIMQSHFESQARQIGKSMRYRVEVSNFDTACRIVSAHLGVAIVPREIACRYAESLRLKVIALDETWARREFVICSRSTHAMPALARSLLEHLFNCAKVD